MLLTWPRKTVLAALIGLGIISSAAPAHAFVAVVATSVAADTIDDDEQLGRAIQAALVNVLKVITVRPSVLELQKVQLAGDRIYLLFLVADSDGEQMLRVFSRGQPTD